MTILALDPDLFWAATVNSRCNYLLEDIAEKIQNDTYRLALDGAKVEAEFLDLYNQFAGKTDGNERAVMQIYGPVVKGFRHKVADLPSDPVDDTISALKQTLEEFLILNHCQEPVEPELTRMAYRAGQQEKGEGVAIVLVGDDIVCSSVNLRSRRLDTAAIRIQLDKIGIRIQNVTNLVPPIRDPLSKPEVEPSHYHSQNFERAVCIKMHNMFGGIALDPVPLEQLGLGKQEDIDVYLCERIANPRKVWIGECRLYKEGNEREWVESKKVKQLYDRLPKVKSFEENQPDCSGKVEVHGFLISNADLIDKDSWLWLVSEMQAHDIQVHFYQAILEVGWANPDGRLKIKALEHIESPFDESYYADASP